MWTLLIGYLYLFCLQFTESRGSSDRRTITLSFAFLLTVWGEGIILLREEAWLDLLIRSVFNSHEPNIWRAKSYSDWNYIHLLIVALEEHFGDCHCLRMVVRAAGNYIRSTERVIYGRGANCWCAQIEYKNSDLYHISFWVMHVMNYGLGNPKEQKDVVSASDVIFLTLDLVFDVKWLGTAKVQ
jgi:hypothetical protein